MALYGLLIGLPLSTASIAWLIVSDYSPAIALWGFIPNKLGIIPLALAYVGLLSIINNKVNEKRVMSDGKREKEARNDKQEERNEKRKIRQIMRNEKKEMTNDRNT